MEKGFSMRNNILTIFASLLMLFCSYAYGEESKECLEAINHYYQLNAMDQIKVMNKKPRSPAELNDITVAKTSVKNSCSNEMTNLAFNASPEDVFGGKNKSSPSLKQVCMSTVWVMFMMIEGAKENPALKSELPQMLHTFFKSTDKDNISYIHEKEFFIPIRDYFVPILEAKIESLR